MTTALLALLLLAPASPARREAVVIRTLENMYSGPGLDKDVVSQATLGQVVAVLETKGAFRRIETPDRYRGWIPTGALVLYPTASAPRYASKGAVLDVVNLMANLYREPSVTSARPKIQAPMGARLEAVGPPKEGWHRVRLPSGEAAFVQTGDVRAGDASDKRERGSDADLLTTARRFLGVPYLWGGMTVHGLDCSGYVSLVYRLHGVDLLRDADLQYDDPSLEKVERTELRPGDLVFFGKKKVTHVGLYVGGERFLSATTHQTPVVQESGLDEPYWASVYIGARRPR
jgi:gamma-D-glutamyl-L-lysine dipeptidyl-peptidase